MLQMTEGPALRVASVFVAGGQPQYTYVPRDNLGLEETVSDYLDKTHRILSVTGPTKIGKTVLLKKVLSDRQPIWITGGTTRSTDDLWEAVADELVINTAAESESATAEYSEGSLGGEVNAYVAKFNSSARGGSSSSRSERVSRRTTVEVAVRKELRASVRPLVIEDFHYIEPGVQLGIVRALKDLVFDGLPVIFIAVPHRAYDVVRVETEMTGRLDHLQIQFWSNDELRSIASAGFTALNLVDEDNIITERLVEQSFASPHLMQEFCYEVVVKVNGIRLRPAEPTALQQPSWNTFFQERASTTAREAFERLASGRRQRADRKQRLLKDERTTDIYGLLLEAIAHTGPTSEINYDALRASMKELLAEDLPTKQEVSRVLTEMSKIAKEIGGEPVVDYDPHRMILHISDPYFSFFLRHGPRPGIGV